MQRFDKEQLQSQLMEKIQSEDSHAVQELLSAHDIWPISFLQEVEKIAGDKNNSTIQGLLRQKREFLQSTPASSSSQMISYQLSGTMAAAAASGSAPPASVPTSQMDLCIPKIIHFIWAGGEGVMPERNIEVIKKWARANPEFQIYLWIDQRTAKADINLKEYYAKKFEDVGKPPLVKDIEENDLENSCCISSPAIRYEIDRIDPNYGASSDLIRYRVLSIYGGVYVDSDVEPGQTLLNDSGLFAPTSYHILCVDHLSQMISPPQNALNEFKFEGEIPGTSPPKKYRLGNDTFICTPNNPLMKKIYEAAEANYQLLANNNFNFALLLAYSSHNIKDVTLEKTGPLLVSNLINDVNIGELSRLQEDAYKKIVKDIIVLIKPVRFKDCRLTQPLKNDKNWLNIPVKRCASLEELYEKLLHAINFELTYLGILRLEDHMRHFVQSGRILNPDKTEPEYMRSFIELVNSQHFDFRNTLVVQSLTSNPIVLGFYTERGLLDKTYTLSNTETQIFESIFNYATSRALMNSIAHLMQSNKNFDETFGPIDYKAEQIKNFDSAICIGINFINKLLEEGTFTKFTDEYEHMLLVYQTIITNFEAAFKRKPSVNIDQIEALRKACSEKHEEMLMNFLLQGPKKPRP